MQTNWTLLLAISLLLGQPARAATWTVYTFESYKRYASAGTGTTFDLPELAEPTKDASLVAFLTTINEPALLGDLAGKTLSASFAVTTSGSPVFTYSGEGTWNPCPMSANVRFFLARDSHTYSLSHANNSPGDYWWSRTTAVSIGPGQASMSVSLDPSNWSDALGHPATDPGSAAAFAAAMHDVQQVGLSFGGGCFYDVGVALVPGTGSADFSLTSFTAQ